MNRHIAREFEARLPLFWEASAKIPEYYIVAPRAVSSKFRHLVLARLRKADEQEATPLGRNGDRRKIQKMWHRPQRKSEE